jgi:hypothetical protein
MVAAAAPEKEDLTEGLPGMDKSPVERAVREESLWPTEPGRPASVPDYAIAAADRCEELRVAHAVTFAYGRLAPKLRDASRLCDLAVLPRPTSPALLTLREALGLALGAGCPCLFSSLTLLQPRHVVAWYDGGAEAARCLRFSCELVALLNLTITVLVSAPSRGRADDLRHEARAVATGYRVDHEITALVGLRPADFAAAADDVAADVAAVPPSKPLAATAIQHSSFLSLIAG